MGVCLCACAQPHHNTGFLLNVAPSDHAPLFVQVHYGAGAYICGEETALIESLEGKQVRPEAEGKQLLAAAAAVVRCCLLAGTQKWWHNMHAIFGSCAATSL
jgi:hypothetical protein